MTKIANLHRHGTAYDISVGSGFTTVNFYNPLTSGQKVAELVDYVDLIKHRVILEETGWGCIWKLMPIYAVHRIGPQFQDREKCLSLPAIAPIGTERVILSTMARYQYQWTGQIYDWVPA